MYICKIEAEHLTVLDSVALDLYNIKFSELAQKHAPIAYQKFINFMMSMIVEDPEDCIRPYGNLFEEGHWDSLDDQIIQALKALPPADLYMLDDRIEISMDKNGSDESTIIIFEPTNLNS